MNGSSFGIVYSFNALMNGANSVHKVFEMLEYEPEVDENCGKITKLKGDIEFQNVQFKYPAA